MQTEGEGDESSAEHPLVLFLDDLQWADCTSFKLIPLIVSGNIRLVNILLLHSQRVLVVVHSEIVLGTFFYHCTQGICC